MDINSIIDKLNTELDKLNNLKKQSVDSNSFFTDNENFNKDFTLDESLSSKEDDNSIYEDKSIDNVSLQNTFTDIPPDDETLTLVALKEQRLLAAQIMFKKSIRISLKSFLISISLSFLNLFI